MRFSRDDESGAEVLPPVSSYQACPDCGVATCGGGTSCPAATRLRALRRPRPGVPIGVAVGVRRDGRLKIVGRVGR
jgi:hypothetical protein